MRVHLRRLSGAGLPWACCIWASSVVAAPAAPAANASSTAAPTPALPAPKTAPKSLNLPIERLTLENGLRIVLSRDASSPTAAVAVTYDVGARNEEKGRSGFAHLFEHMMFQGSRNVPKTGHFTLVSERGGSLNGTTSPDRTNYFEIVPSNALSTALWLEADRMKTLAVTQDNFENQRKVVQEEYRMRVSNAAYAEGMMRLRELVFQGYWPYEHDAIGSMEDLDRAQLAWIREFHRAYYAPNNAVLSISGAFDRDATVALIRKFFGDAKPARVPVYAPPATVPKQAAERRKELTDTNAKTPGLYYGWVIPPNRTKEHYALELASLVLGYGESSVLHQRLVRNDSVARDVGVWTHDQRGPDMFVVRTLLTERAPLETVESLLAEELGRLATEGPSKEQLDRARQQLQSAFLFGLEGNMERATTLGTFELFNGDAGLINQELARYFEVTGDQIRSAVAKYLVPATRSVIVVRPPAPAAPTTAPVGAH
jgi:zinc protease